MNQPEQTPSRGALIKSVAAALVAALAAFVLFVLPAEFGRDPTGVGRLLGLNQLAAVEDDHDDEPSRTVVGTYPGLPDADTFDYFEPDVFGEPFSKGHEKAFRDETFTIRLDVSEQVEYKAIMDRGDAVVYTWSVDASTVYTDFHADPGADAEGYPEGYFIRYRESETAEDSGSLVAPFAGYHGWYWLNIEERPVTITLRVAGYFDRIEELFREYQ